MSQNNQVQSISYTIDEKARKQKLRHTLQPKPNTINLNQDSVDDQRPRSLSLNKKHSIVIEPPIPEVDTEDEEGKVRLDSANSSTRTSFTRKPPSRSNSYTTVKSRIVEVKGYENSGGHGEGQFQRGYTDSTRSSAHSLPVQREQYCCCSKWSRFERRLALSVGILAGVIIGLAITVGLLAKDDDKKGVDETFVWKP